MADNPPTEGQLESMAAERAAARGALVHSEERYRLLVDSVSDYAIYMLDPTGQVISWNKGAERFKGYVPAEIIGRSYHTFFSDEDRTAGKPDRLLRRALDEGHVADEGWRIRKDGTRFWADVVITPMYDAAGTHIGYSKVTRDLTERKMAEEQRRQLTLLVENVTDYAIIMLTPDGLIASWNKGAEALKGYTESEIKGSPYERFFLPEDVAAGKPRRLLAKARELGHIEDEGWRRRKDGTRFWASAVLTAIYDEGGEFIGYGKVTRDLTERRQMEDLTAQAIQLQAANRIKSEFLANMSHELRTPLNAIIGYTDLVATDESLKLDPINQENLQTVLRNGRHLLTLINDILDLSKIEAGQVAIHHAEFDPRQTVQSVLTTLRPQAEAKGLALRAHLDSGVERVHSDEVRVRQILINLVSNAVKFTPAGGVDVTLADCADGRWSVAVRDTGVGVAPEHQELIFQEFKQVDGSYTRAQGGTGLGLSISRRLAELLGGELTLESTLGEGSVFTLVLPA